MGRWGGAGSSATAWEHPTLNRAGQPLINPVGLAAVIVERGPTEAFDTLGDPSAGSIAFPLTGSSISITPPRQMTTTVPCGW